MGFFSRSRAVLIVMLLAFLTIREGAKGAANEDAKGPQPETPTITLKNAVRADAAKSGVCYLHFSPDRKHLLVAPAAMDKADAETFTLADFDLAGGNPVKKFSLKLPGNTSHYALSQDLGLLAAAISPTAGGSVNKAVGGFETSSGKRLWLLEGPTTEIDALALANAGQLVATGNSVSGNGQVFIWDVPTRKPIFTVASAKDYIPRSMTLSRDGKWAVWLAKNQIHVIDVAARKEYAVMPAKGVEVAAIAPDCNTLMTLGNRVIAYWDLKKHRNADSRLALLDTQPFITFSDDGSYALVGIGDELIHAGLPLFHNGDIVRPRSLVGATPANEQSHVATVNSSGDVEIYKPSYTLGRDLPKLVGTSARDALEGNPPSTPNRGGVSPVTKPPLKKN